MTHRITQVFERLKAENRKGLISFIMAGDPTPDIARSVLMALPQSGVDIIELGMPFTDPMADGIVIQKAGLRALQAGQTLKKTLEDVKFFRDKNQTTPIILMGYYNPIYIYGCENFLHDAVDAGVDGLIIVDLPPEEDSELCLPSQNYDIDFIRLLTPTTVGKRFEKTLKHTNGFLYYVSVAGVTGEKTASQEELTRRIKEIKTHSTLPLAVGFGIKTPHNAKIVADSGADAVVVGSAIVEKVGAITQNNTESDIYHVMSFVRSIADVL